VFAYKHWHSAVSGKGDGLFLSTCTGSVMKLNHCAYRYVAFVIKTVEKQYNHVNLWLYILCKFEYYYLIIWAVFAVVVCILIV